MKRDGTRRRDTTTASRGISPVSSSKYLAFLEKGWGPGEGENFFSREKKLFPFPRNHRPLSGTERRKKSADGEAGIGEGEIGSDGKERLENETAELGAGMGNDQVRFGDDHLSEGDDIDIENAGFAAGEPGRGNTGRGL